MTPATAYHWWAAFAVCQLGAALLITVLLMLEGN